MLSKRIWVIGLAALAVSALIVFERFRSVPKQQPSRPAAVLKTDAVQNVYGYEVVHEYPHDTQAFTQGLIFLDGYLYESTGRTGRSSLRKVRLETGEVIQQRAVNPGDFGEGLTEWRGRLVPLTPRRRGSEPAWHLRKFFEDVRRHFGDKVAVTYAIAP